MTESSPDSARVTAPGAAPGSGVPPVELSVVIPFKDEAGNAGPLAREVIGVLRELKRTWELVLVDDGSRDATARELLDAIRGESNVVLVKLRKSFGQTAAIAAGFDRARGAVIVTLDGDGQNDPRGIPLLLERLEKGADVVSGWRRERKDPFLRRMPSWFANRLIRRISGVHLQDLGCALKAYRREVLEGVRLYGEMHRFLPIYASWQGAEVAEVAVAHRARQHGRSKYGLERTVKVVLDLVVMVFLQRYSTRPIYVFGGFGLLFLLAAFGAGLLTVGFKLIEGRWHKDFVQTPLPLLVVFLGVTGILSILMGLLAEMIMRTYFESQRKPVYVVREVVSPPSAASG